MKELLKTSLFQCCCMLDECPSRPWYELLSGGRSTRSRISTATSGETDATWSNLYFLGGESFGGEGGSFHLSEQNGGVRGPKWRKLDVDS